MIEYPYVYAPGHLTDLIKRIPDLGIPPKFTFEFLLSLGYRAHNERAMIRVLKFIDFLEQDGTPTKNYKDYRNREISKAIMASCIKNSYNELFTTFPDAYRQDDMSLRNFFSTHTKGGETVQKLTVDTFKALCEYADFEEQAPQEPETRVTLTEGVAKYELKEGKKAGIPTGQPIVINLNVQLQLPVTEDPSVYDRIFESLRKHVLGK